MYPLQILIKRRHKLIEKFSTGLAPSGHNTLINVALNMDTPGAKQQALEHILQTLQVMFAREAVVVALRGHAMLGCAHNKIRFLLT
jgi:hypothetical protein